MRTPSPTTGLLTRGVRQMSDVFDLPGARIALETLRVLDKASIDFYERHISYRERDGKPRFSVGLDCSDTFWWGTADLEEVTEETFPVLIETLKDYKYGLGNPRRPGQ